MTSCTDERPRDLVCLQVITPLLGKYNVYNVLAAVAVGISLNINLQVCSLFLSRICAHSPSCLSSPLLLGATPSSMIIPSPQSLCLPTSPWNLELAILRSIVVFHIRWNTDA